MLDVYIALRDTINDINRVKHCRIDVFIEEISRRRAFATFDLSDRLLFSSRFINFENENE